MSLLFVSYYLTNVTEDDQSRTFFLQRPITAHQLQFVVDASGRTVDRRFNAEAWRLIASFSAVCPCGQYYIAKSEQQREAHAIRLQKLPTPLAILLMVEDHRFGIVPTQDHIVLVKKNVKIEVFPEQQCDDNSRVVGLGYKI